MMQYLTESIFLHRCVMLVDLKVGLMESDKLLINMLADLQKIFIVVCTKADKIPAEEVQD